MTMTLYGVKDSKRFQKTFSCGAKLQEFLKVAEKDPSIKIKRLKDNNPKPYVNDPNMLYQGGNEED